jgi:recombination DNA repair RAD52 pathway protein
MPNKSPKKQKRSTALTIRPASFSPMVRALIQLPTPQEFIKTRPGKGGKSFTYVEGGYVIALLNKMFKNCWDFEVIDERIEQTEVVIRGRLVIKDFKSGYEVSKTQYGTKERNAGVPLGDTLKAAATDCLKKCASLFGIALDIYWKQEYLDDSDKPKLLKKSEGVKKISPSATTNKEEAIRLALEKIKNENDQTILAQYFERIKSTNFYNDTEKTKLIKAIAAQRKKYVTNNEKQEQESMF